jgi:release factor glutamine methyltransferase
VTTHPSLPSLHDVLAQSRRRLVAAGLMESGAEADVDVLARHVLGWDRATLLVRRRDPAPEGFEAAIDTLVARRATREPVAYLTGHREFWGLDFEVTSDVLVPRPETELIVEEALAAVRGGGLQRADGERRERGGLQAPGSGLRDLRVLDVGTGSGCVAVAIASEIEEVSIVATDISVAALRVAQRNARRLGVADRVRFVAGDLMAPLRRSTPWVDLLVSNPPYVPRASQLVMPDVLRFEPATALFGGVDGLSYMARLVVEAASLVRPGGLLIFEFGDGQGDLAEALVHNAGVWSIERVRDDLQGIPRTCVARRIP